jgi:arginine exporter protein ArgO
MSKTTKNSFFESFKGSNGKIDHKRLTVFVFALMFICITVVGLYKKTPIVNQTLIETILYIIGSVILGGMGLTKIKTKTETTNETQ